MDAVDRESEIATGRGAVRGPGTVREPAQSEVGEVVESVGPRLRERRTARGLSLTALSERTGISVSTLSRLETGARIPGLEHLVALARAHHVSLDALVGTRFSWDPRLRYDTYEDSGRTVMPIAPAAGGLWVEHAIIRPPASGIAEPAVHVHGHEGEVGGHGAHGGGRGGGRGRAHVFEPEALQTHRGYVWLLVLAGSLRLLVGAHDLVLDPGEAAEFDTRVPHWLGPAVDQPAEVLNVHGPEGQRIRVRARPKQ
ncbi:helix-turn-helix domain-containing protein [Brevibacterium yomogidense]|uniref:Putative regulatory protein n=1 Tax=Brevibacterium yomogidense TaxID=946573 RepID=A0A1X6WZK1_9MICO|nr:XRE family transcriptional regulator [Brevibacterium yomogidense]SLM91359.1 putative regulatory protein [Brevibacterium yomogidense]